MCGMPKGSPTPDSLLLPFLGPKPSRSRRSRLRTSKSRFYRRGTNTWWDSTGERRPRLLLGRLWPLLGACPPHSAPRWRAMLGAVGRARQQWPDLSSADHGLPEPRLLESAQHLLEKCPQVGASPGFRTSGGPQRQHWPQQQSQLFSASIPVFWVPQNRGPRSSCDTSTQVPFNTRRSPLAKTAASEAQKPLASSVWGKNLPTPLCFCRTYCCVAIIAFLRQMRLVSIYGSEKVVKTSLKSKAITGKALYDRGAQGRGEKCGRRRI